MTDPRQQPWPTTVQRNQRPDAGPEVPQPRHGRVPGPAPVPMSAFAPQAAPPAPAPRDSSAMTALRIIAYVLTSLASLLFIALVVYGAIKVNQLQDALQNSPFGTLGSSSNSSPNLGTRPAICATDPTNPVCYGG